MSVRSLILSLLAVLWLWPITAYGQAPELLDAHKRAGVLYALGRYQEALPFAEKALRLGERKFGPDHPQVTRGLNDLGELYRLQGKYAEAEPLHKRALAIWESALGPEHPNVAKGLENYASLRRKMGFSAEAARLEAQARAIRAKHAKENPAQ